MTPREKPVLPSASSLDRVKHCPASHALPWTGRVTPASERGHLVHEYVLRKARNEPFVAPEEMRVYLDSIDVEAIPEGEYEVGFAYNVHTGIARRLDRTTPYLSEAEIGGRADIVDCRVIDTNKWAYVGDLKTGLGHHVPPVADCLQVKFYALAAAREMQTDRAMAEVIRIGETGRVKTEVAYFDSWALDAIALELSDLVRAVEQAKASVAAGGVPPVVTGLHCKFCPAFSACPEQRALAGMMARSPQELEKDVMTLLTEETAPIAYRRAYAAMEVCKRVMGACYGFAEQHPIDLGDGLILGPVTVRRTNLDGELAHSVLTGMYGRDNADEAVEMKATQAGIKRMLKKTGQPILPGLRKAMQALREGGACSEKSYTRVEVHKATAKELNEGEDEAA